MIRTFRISLLCLISVCTASAQIVLSGNEAKIDLTSGGPVVIPNAPPDSVSVLDFSTFPPRVEHLSGISNTVIGPPSNIAIAPDHSIALIADSVKLDPAHPDQTIPNNLVHVLDLRSRPPKVVAEVEAGAQPSGISFTRDGKLALVANRADGTVSVFAIDRVGVRSIQTVKVCEPAGSVSDVAISPDGRTALASIQVGGYLAVLKIDNGKVTATDRKLSVYGHPYRCVITPDGELGLTAGAGESKMIDADAISVVDLKADPIQTVDYIAIPSLPESIEIHPNGRLLAAVVMDGSNLAPNDPHRKHNGLVVLLARRGKTFEVVQKAEVGAIPEGVAFTSDGKYLVVQCHPSKELRIFSVQGERITDTGRRIRVPGMPSSIRAAP